MSQKYRALFSDFALLIGEERKRPVPSDAPAIIAQFQANRDTLQKSRADKREMYYQN